MEAILLELGALNLWQRWQVQLLLLRYGGIVDIPAEKLIRVLGCTPRVFTLAQALHELAEQLGLDVAHTQIARILAWHLGGRLQDPFSLQHISAMSESPTPRRAVFQHMLHIGDLFARTVDFKLPRPEQRQRFELWLDHRGDNAQ